MRGEGRGSAAVQWQFLARWWCWALLLLPFLLYYRLSSNSTFSAAEDKQLQLLDLGYGVLSPCPPTASKAETIIYKCAGEVTSPLLAERRVPHYASLPLCWLDVEPLLKENLFRKPPPKHPLVGGAWWGDDVEDRSHLKLLPHSLHKFVCELNGLSDHDTDAMPLREVIDAVLPARRVMLDVGGNSFASSVGWFKRNYPVEFTRIFVWEAEPELFLLPNASAAAAKYGLDLDEAVRWLDSITFYNERVHSSPDRSHGDLAHVLLTQVRREDYCVVKIDIEDSEWDLIPRLVSTGAMKLVDELFVEFHFHHPMLAANGWSSSKFPHTVEQTAETMTRLRRRHDLIFHYWP